VKTLRRCHGFGVLLGTAPYGFPYGFHTSSVILLSMDATNSQPKTKDQKNYNPRKILKFHEISPKLDK
jgi:hypothetical protein